ncbi:MAG TPA: hypothetical protein VK324_17210, partial [Tepidisphaeraceae bacterium]|nr:hypothetical protein [Tepidisphaeraceae bacterium]
MTGAPKLRITAAELNTPEVDAKLRDREVVTGARRHYDEADVPTAAPRRPRWAWLYWPPLCFALAGLLGGLAGWALGQPLHLRPDLRSEAADVVAAADDARARAADGRLTAAEAEAIVGELRRDAAANPYAVAELDPSLTPAERQSRLDAQASLDARAAFWADFLFYGVGGLCLAACLSCVEPLIERNWPRAAVVGATAAGVGLAGGVAAALLSASLLAAAVPQGLVPAACYALLGLFVGVPPGLVLRSSRRAAVGAAAG